MTSIGPRVDLATQCQEIGHFLGHHQKQVSYERVRPPKGGRERGWLDPKNDENVGLVYPPGWVFLPPPPRILHQPGWVGGPSLSWVLNFQVCDNRTRWKYPRGSPTARPRELHTRFVLLLPGLAWREKVAMHPTVLGAGGWTRDNSSHEYCCGNLVSPILTANHTQSLSDGSILT